MKKSLGNKLDKAITKSYTELYQQMDWIRFNADQLAKGDYADEKAWEDIMQDITEAYDIAAFGCIAPLTFIGCLLLDIPLMYFYKLAVMFTIIYIIVDIFFE